MDERRQGGVLEFVRRATKAIAERWLPDELAYHDVVWRALEPVLIKPDGGAAGEKEILDLVTVHVQGHGLAGRWSRDADLLTAPLMMVLNRSLDKAIATGVLAEDEIGQIVAQEAVRRPLPDRFLRLVQGFVVEFCGGVSMPDEETENLLHGVDLWRTAEQCYFVFHNGSNHFYPNELPEVVLRIREKVLFWIHRAAGDFCSRGRPRSPADRPTPQAECVLRFLCDERNAGKTIPLADLFSRVWQKRPDGGTKNPVMSIRVEVSRLNRFAVDLFEGESGNVMVRYVREAGAYRIRAETPTECCIVRPISLPE